MQAESTPRAVVPYRGPTPRRAARTPAATRPPLPANKERLDGLIVEGSDRVSTGTQAGNWSTGYMTDELREAVEGRGGTLVLHDEQAISGRRLADREILLGMLARITAGQSHALAFFDIKRLTRDEFAIDGGTIAKLLTEARAPLVTQERVYWLWLQGDLKAYKREVGEAGDDLIDTRNKLWGGLFQRAGTEPVLRGVIAYGYDPVRVEYRNDKNVLKTKRLARKDDAEQEAMAYLVVCLEEEVSAGAVARRMNDAGYLRTVRSGKRRGERVAWQSHHVKEMLTNPLYQGVWDFARHSDRTGTLWDIARRREKFAPRDAAELGYDLAYWTPAQARRWDEKFTPAEDGPAASRGSTYERSLLRLLVCAGCGGALIGAGKDGYRCPQHYVGRRKGEVLRQPDGTLKLLPPRCSGPTYVRAALALAAVRAILPGVMVEADDEALKRKLQGQLDEPTGADTLRAKIAVLESGLEVAAEQWYGKRMPDAYVARLEHDQLEVDRLREELQREEAASPRTEEAETFLRKLLNDPDALEDEPEPTQGWLARQLTADVELAASGRGPGRRVWVAAYTNRFTRLRMRRTEGPEGAFAPEGDDPGNNDVAGAISAYSLGYVAIALRAHLAGGD